MPMGGMVAVPAVGLDVSLPRARPGDAAGPAQGAGGAMGPGAGRHATLCKPATSKGEALQWECPLLTAVLWLLQHICESETVH